MCRHIGYREEQKHPGRGIFFFFCNVGCRQKVSKTIGLESSAQTCTVASASHFNHAIYCSLYNGSHDRRGKHNKTQISGTQDFSLHGRSLSRNKSIHVTSIVSFLSLYIYAYISVVFLFFPNDLLDGALDGDDTYYMGRETREKSFSRSFQTQRDCSIDTQDWHLTRVKGESSVV